MVNCLWALGAAVVAFLISTVLGRILIPFLHKLKFGQTILEIGPDWHKKKQGTPTMGGIMFIVAILVSTALFYGVKIATSSVLVIEQWNICIGLVMALCYGIIGFIDDYIKVVKKRNLGLTAVQKLVMQFAVTIAFLLAQHLIGHLSTIVTVPFLGTYDLGIIYYPIVFLGISFMVNAVNLTDGIDGLCSSVTFVVAIGFLLISATFGYYSNAMFACALAGSLVGFLVWNFHPAKVFMGDTGSMFLGGAVVAMAWAVNRPEVLVFIGIIYTIEAVSVMIQMTYFKLTKGKRLFKMTPIHHHFEMCKWSEEKIVWTFTGVAAIFGIISFLYMYFC